MSGLVLAWHPLLDWPFIGVAAALAVLLIGWGVARRAAGSIWRVVAVGSLLLALAGPVAVKERRDPRPDVALLVKDVSPSQRIGDRAKRADVIADAMAAKLRAMPGLELRQISIGAETPGGGDHGTEAIGPIAEALKDVPPERLAGVALITDGEVHDVPADGKPPVAAPFHVILDGQRDEADRRLVIDQAPTFGIVGKDVPLTFRVEETAATGVGGSGAAATTARVTIRKDGGAEQVATVPVGVNTTLSVPVDHGGPNVFELSVEPGPQELTLDNNRAAVVVNGVRDRLKVLLVSGEPHAGERTWRNLLKADPSVDLVHFTILRPPEKQDRTPIRELSLIAFPIHELFDLKLNEFDLVIFDRYQRRGVLPQTYLENIERYVRNGGALLEAAGTSESSVGSLLHTPVGSVLPAEPSGRILTGGFKPRISADGSRHPVTADLPGAAAGQGGEPGWGRWFRADEAATHAGVTVMTGRDDQPLLVLDRVDKGRVAQLLSDQMWLWTRGFEGGGPQAELLRRLAYWLMKEPDLEEEDLRAVVEGDRLRITRHSLDATPHSVTVTRPDKSVVTVALADGGGGRAMATLPVTESGLYRIEDGTRTALAAAGALNPLELSDVRTTDAKLKPIVRASGGQTIWAGTGQPLPELRRVGKDDSAGGPGWIGFRANGDYVVTGLTQTELLPPWAALLMSLGALLAAWRREGR